MTYTIHESAVELNGRFIPKQFGNQDYDEYLALCAEWGISPAEPDGVHTFAPGPRTLPEAKLQLVQELAEYRYEQECSGITVNGAVILTDRDSQAKVHAAYFGITAGLATAVKWKAANGWVELGAAGMQAVASAVFSHVQACFAREAELQVAIESLETFEAAQAFDIASEWSA